MANTCCDIEQLDKFKQEMDKLALQSEKKSIEGKFDLHMELYKSFLRLGQNATDQDIQDIIYFLVDVYNKNNDQQIGYDEVDWDNVC